MTASAVLLAAFALAIGILLFALRPRAHAAEHVRLYDMMRLRGVPPRGLGDPAAAPAQALGSRPRAITR